MYGYDLTTILSRRKAIDVSLVRGSRSNLARIDKSNLLYNTLTTTSFRGLVGGQKKGKHRKDPIRGHHKATRRDI